MRKFLSKRLLGIPVALVMVLVLVGGVAAAYVVHSYTIDVTVDECLEIENYSGDGGEQVSGGVWNTNLDPGQTKILNLKVCNSGEGTVTAKAAVSGGEANVDMDLEWDRDNTLGPGKCAILTTTAYAYPDADPGTYSFQLDISRD